MITTDPADGIIMLHRDPFVKTVDRALRHRCGVREGDALLVAVSGGADSVALLRALAVIADRPHWQLRLHVAHVHHHLREEADADAAFVVDLAQQLGLPFHLAHIQPAESEGNLENAARRLRYDALTSIAHECDTPLIATAHHADDQLETMLMRLVRGSSVRGLSGMASRRKLDDRTTLIRPMLRLTHATAVDFLGTLDQPWREDATNAETTRWRARLRAHVLPELRRLRPDAAEKAADTADALRDAARLADQQIARTIADTVTRDSQGTQQLSRAAARALSPALLRGVLRQVLLEAGARPDALGRRALHPIVQSARSPSGETKRFEIAGGVAVTITAQTLTCDSPRSKRG